MTSLSSRGVSLSSLNRECIFATKLILFILLTLTSPYRCDSSDSNLSSSGSVNVTNNFISNSKSSKSIDGVQATITNDDIQNGQQIPLVRLPSNTLLKYTAYKDVSIQHFLIPMDSRSAMFSFKSYEESKSALTRVCQPQDVTLHLKAGSYPVISPENITFPKHFLSAEQRYEIYTLQFKSDGQTRRMTIDGPQPGNWFAVAFISWTDPNNERIEQQGLSPSCETLLLSEMTVTRTSLRILNSDVEFNDSLYTNATAPNSYKFFVPRNVDICTFKLTITRPCIECKDINFIVQSRSLPTAKNYLHSTIINVSQINDDVIEFYPHENAWHYVDLKFLDQQNASKNASSAIVGNNSNAVQHRIEFNMTIGFQLKNTNGNIDDDNGVENNNNRIDTSNDDFMQYIPPMPKNRLFDEYPLMRQTYREFFMYDYDLVPDVNGTVPISINLTSRMPALMKFEIGDVYDIGGTLTFAIAMKSDVTSTPIRDESSPSSTSSIYIEQAIAEKLTAEEAKINNQTVIICIRLNEPGIPTFPDKCTYGRQTFPANTIINNTNDDTSMSVIHIPFPESGTWYVTMGLFCTDKDTAVEATARTTIIDSVKTFIRHNSQMLKSFHPQCSCVRELNLGHYSECLETQSCLTQMNETETLKIKECLMDAKCTSGEHIKLSRAFDIHHKRATEQSVNGKSILGCTDANCNTSIAFTLASNPCVTGRCGRNGRCYHYMSGGFVFSTCLCLKFYRGWDCTEDSQVPSSISILAASLLLTLSNLLFIPSVYFAIRRSYYTEAIIYFFAMFFSTFYHACDSGDEEFTFCLVKISVLQFCDFYCGLLAIWVTLIAMANVRPSFVSILHMLGAILLAFGTELNKQSLWVFLAPALSGICIVSFSWTMKCRKHKKVYPSKKYFAIYLPLGSILVMIGLICYAFLQTKQNYHIVHSIWHMVMAMSILCLLPKRKMFEEKC
ncbi:hypothetical protein PVAND_002101 [Polypedilum vanderplanki]|uniref:EGF-like domain-containing protein n=1 Tax=Polypedilum vanderplanki TaxID=319348 RepID=A0A9J6BQH6_POLVA|nr:hypothetical protein PVAND_002101 [Polypedilum vanderplanki]